MKSQKSKPVDTHSEPKRIGTGRDASVAPFDWGRMERLQAIFENPEVLTNAGTALPLLLHLATEPSKEPLHYQVMADIFSCSLSSIKAWSGHLETQGLIRKTSCGKAGFLLELIPEAIGSSESIRRIREQIDLLRDQLNSIRQVVEGSFSTAVVGLENLNT